MAVGGSSRWVGHPDGWVVSASRAATGLLTVLAHLRDANTLMVMKSIALGSASPRIYSDLRATALLGCYYFTFTSLAPHLDFNDNYTCSAGGVPHHEQRRRLQTAGGGTGAQ